MWGRSALQPVADMRFAYIDSNGNEVPIPSVEALALRVQLGAISDDTQLYDAQADQWGPATSHEIYHSLSRASGDDAGFAVPPPVARPSPSEPEAVAEPESHEAAATDGLAEDGLAEDGLAEQGAVSVDLGLTLAEEPEPVEDALTIDLGGLEMASSDAAPERDSLIQDTGGVSDEFAFGGIDLEPDFAPLPDPDNALDFAAKADEGLESEVPDPEEKIGSFDFGDMEGGLELETQDEKEPAVDSSAGGLSDDSDDSPVGGFSGGFDEETTPDFSGGMDFDTSMEFDAGEFAGPGGGGLDFETPMSEFSPDEPPAWMAPGTDSRSDKEEVMDFSSVGSDESPEDVPLRDRRTPRDQPSKPKHRRQRARSGPIVAGVFLVAVGVGGWAAWPLLSAGFSGGGDLEIASGSIPSISAELMPAMRRAADATFDATFAQVRSDIAGSDPIASPSSDWLAGAYLANASQFDRVEGFWTQMGGTLDGLRAIDLPTFDAAYQVAQQSEDAPAAQRALMRARADSGFAAPEAAAARTVTFDQAQALIDASVRLHQFLIANEANIAYAPAGSVTTDPVLEVDPATDEIRKAMEGLIDQITTALSVLGSRDQVTADGLWALVLERIKATGLQ